MHSAGSEDAPSTGSADAPSADSAGSVRALSARTGASRGKLPIEPVSLAKRSKRLKGVCTQYVVAELFPSITDDEDDDDGVNSVGETRSETVCSVRDNITGFWR
jgi:hypothetical protein